MQQASKARALWDCGHTVTDVSRFLRATVACCNIATGVENGTSCMFDTVSVANWVRDVLETLR